MNPTIKEATEDRAEPPWAAEVLDLLRAILETLRTEQTGEVRPSEADLLTMRDLAERTGFSLSTLERMLARGKLPTPLRFGRNVRFRRADVERWLEEHAEPEQRQARDRR